MKDTSYRWVVVAYTILLQAVVVGTIIYCFGLFAVPWLEEFGASRAEVMFAISLQQVGFGLISPFAGWAIDRFRMRRIVLAGAVTFAAGWAFLGVATTLWQVQLVFALLFPLTMALMGTLVAQTLVTRWFTDKRGLAFGISATGTNLGGIILPLVVAPALTVFEWREVALWLGLGGLALVLPMTWVVLARRSPSGPEAGHKPGSGSVLTVGQILRSLSFWIPVLCMVPLNLGFAAAQFNLAVFAGDLGFAAEAGMLLALCSACMVMGKFLFGGLADLIDHRALYWLAAAFMGVSLVLLQNEPGWWRLCAGVVFLGLSGGSLIAIMAVFVGARFAVEHFGRVMGFVMLSLSISAIGPILAGWAYDTRGSYDLAFALIAGSLVPAAILMRWLPKPLATQ